MEFVFESAPWELFIRQLSRKQRVKASYLLTLLEGEEEQSVADVLRELEERETRLDLTDLPRPKLTGDNGLRLKQEAELAKQDLRPELLEETDPLRVFLEELAGIPAFGDICLLAGELAELRNGDPKENTLRQQIVNLSLSRVVELAAEYTGWGVRLEDLIQEGSLGLWSATQEYSENCMDFEAFRDEKIRFAMEKAVFLQAREDGVGRNMRQALEDFRMADEQLLMELGRNPTLEEIGQKLHRTLEETVFFADLLENVRRMDRAKPAEKPEEQIQEESEQAVEDTAYFQMRQRIGELLSMLPETEAELLTLRFGLEGGLPLSPEETGKKLGLTPDEVVQKEASALMRLRNEKK